MRMQFPSSFCSWRSDPLEWDNRSWRSRSNTGEDGTVRDSTFLEQETRCARLRLSSLGPANAEVDRSTLLGARPDDVVPVTMKRVPLDLQRVEVLGGNLLARRIASTIEPCADDEAAAVGRVADQVDDRLVGPQRPAAPVDRDVREQAVLDLVPLAGAGREVADVDGEVECIGQPLEFGFPKSGSVAVAPTRVGGDEQLARVGIALRADVLPPRLDRGDRKHRRVVIDAHADEPIVGGDVVHAVRDRLADCSRWEVVNIDPLGRALGLPLASAVLEVPDQLLLLGVDGDDRHAALDAILRLGVDVLKLRVAIRVLRALDGLVRRLQAIAVLA